MKDNSSSGGSSSRNSKCANCFACRKGTELCPLHENYDEETAWQLLNEQYSKNKKASPKGETRLIIKS